MISFDDLQKERPGKVGQEQTALAIATLLPQMRTTEDLEELERQGYNVRSIFGQLRLGSLKPHRDKLGLVNRALVRESRSLMERGIDIRAADIGAACVSSSGLALELILQPPPGVEVCSRNPKLELPHLARLLLQAKLFGRPVPFVVPCCPDITSQYRLSDGLGKIVPKALDYCSDAHSLLTRYSFGAHFDVQVADVEALDPAILANSEETTESYFAKTGETIRKTQAEISSRGYGGFIAARSMLSAFTEIGMEYGTAQVVATDQIVNSQDKKVNRVVDELLTERTGLGDFDRFGASNRRELVIAELAGYAAYGAMVGGRAVILSPDAKSAIPAYHYSLDKPEQYSPVLYAS